MRISYANRKHFDALMRGWDLSNTAVNNATALDNLYSTSDRLGTLQSFLEIEWVVNDLVTNPLPLNVLAQSSAVLGLMLNSPLVRSYLTVGSLFSTVLEAAVNNSTYLYREMITATGNYTPNINGNEAMFIVAAGIGGSGADANNAYAGQGGSGGELVGVVIPAGNIPTSAVSCTLPTSVGTPTTFGSFASAVSGNNGQSSSYIMRPGGGSTSNGGASNFNPDSAAYRFEFSQQGGDGGRPGSDPDNPNTTQIGEPGETGSFGSGGTAGVGSGAAGGAGSGICSGGGGGYATDVGTGLRNGDAATDPGCGGGGGNSNDGDASYGSGGAGGPAKIWIYTVRKRV